jgi:hypothetical protein
VDLVAAVVADEEPLEVVQPSEGALDDPAGTAQSGAMFGLAARDLGGDAASAQLPPVLVVVVATVGGHPFRPAARTADPRAHGRHPFDQWDELGYVVAVAARDRPGARNARCSGRGEQIASWMPQIRQGRRTTRPRRRLTSEVVLFGTLRRDSRP